MNERQIAIVTGAANGIGAEVARKLAHAGYSLALIDNDKPKLEQHVAELKSQGHEVAAFAIDLCDLAAVEAAVDQVIATHHRIDLLINNAAWREIVSMREISVESWEKTIRSSLTAPAFLARWAARQMERQNSGVIVNVSSIMAHQAGGYSPAYCAAKGGLESLTYELAALYGVHGIRVVALQLGAIDTGMSIDDSLSSSAMQSIREYSESMCMNGRWGSVAEAADAICWVASDQASYLTGTAITLDGGWSRHHLPAALKQALISSDNR